MLLRVDGRKTEDLRPFKITRDYLSHPAGSCLIEMGGTRVVCSAVIEENVPGWLRGSGKGWLTAEYSMLPASSSQRIQRERSKVGGRTMEIQRLIGRSLRACVDLSKFGERTIQIDCDVLDADGGTRTAAITGAYVALALAVKKLPAQVAELAKPRVAVAAVSVGMVNGVPCLDLNYPEAKDAEVDMNVVMTSEGLFVEVQGTAESKPFDRKALDGLLALAQTGITRLFDFQKKVLAS